VSSFGGPSLIASLSSMLGIRPGMNIAVHGAPAGFMDALQPLPDGVSVLDTSARTGLDVQVLFAQKKVELVEKLTSLSRGMSVVGSLWICFPAGSENPHAPSEDFVRLAALELGLTDTRRLMLDPAWNALKLQWKPRNPKVELPSARA
jgi:hypothetical protein